MRSTLTLALLLSLVPAAARAGQGSEVAKARRLYRLGDWESIVKQFPDSPQLPAELEFYRGMALARLGRLNDARQALIEGRKKDPGNEKFPLELAGIAFKQDEYGEAKSRLREALRLNPQDAYAREFLATIFFLSHNLDAALANWNRIDEPQIRDLIVDPPVRVDPELLSRTFTFSPFSTLSLKDLRTTRARVVQLGIFSKYRFTLVPAGAGRTADPFGLKFSAIERNGWGKNLWVGFLSLLRGLPYETISPEYFNLHGRAINLTSLFRWDDQKRRIHLDFSAPLGADPKWRYRFFVDGRNENWDIAHTSHGGGSLPTDLNIRKGEAGAEIDSVVSGRWSWSAGAAVARRTYRNFSAPAQAKILYFADSTSLEYRVGTNYLLVDRPERRFTLDSSVSAQIGTTFSQSSGRYHRLEATMGSVWFPRSSGDDYRMSEEVHLGAAGGDVPFDELFMVGLERDNDLPLRAHIGTLNGRKGNAPLGRRYFLSNWEVDKNVYSNGWVALKAAPFLDSARVTDPTGLFGAPGWFWDTGAELKVQTFGGLTVVLTYGKDLRTGRNTFYSEVKR